jgi:hypothetical protein
VCCGDLVTDTPMCLHQYLQQPVVVSAGLCCGHGWEGGGVQWCQSHVCALPIQPHDAAS